MSPAYQTNMKTPGEESKDFCFSGEDSKISKFKDVKTFGIKGPEKDSQITNSKI